MTDSPTYIRFWSGLTSIGGTVISLENGRHRLIFDFGLSYNPGEAYLDGQVKLRPTALVQDHLHLNMIPPIDGIYGHQNIGPSLDLVAAEESDRQSAVLISHLHLDHMGAMGLTHSDIPVYLTEDSHRLYQALEHIGEGVAGTRTYSTCAFDTPFTHGPFTITPLAVDHDIPGACSFHIRTPHGSLLYTGDFRLHGQHPEVAYEWLEKAKALGIDILISEGTTLRPHEEGQNEPLLGDPAHPATLITEAALPAKVQDIVGATTTLAVFNLYHRNLVRLATMLDVGQMSGRVVALEPETAYLATKLLGRNDFSVYIGENTHAEQLSGQTTPWKKALLAELPQVTAAMLRQNPSGYFVQNSYPNCLELLDLLGIGGCYIHSNGMPLGSFDPAYPRLKKLLERLKLDYHYVGTSGHAIMQHLQYVSDELAPRVLVPLHSFNPHRLQANHGQQLLPTLGVVYQMQAGLLQEIDRSH
ncbi:MAG: Ribonuclease J [Firmicutes bacterium]|nr:Ribonuclease J [Bacillota bacterium]